MLFETVHGSDGNTLNELGREWCGVGDEEVSDCLHVLLERGDLLLRLQVFLLLFDVVFNGVRFRDVLCGGSCLGFSFFLLLDLDSEESLTESLLGLHAVNEGDRGLLVAFSLCSDLQELVEEVLVVGR